MDDDGGRSAEATSRAASSSRVALFEQSLSAAEEAKESPSNDGITSTAPQRSSLSSFSDTLPDVVVKKILRFFSSRPRYEEWFKHIATRDAVLMLQLDGPLGDAARRRITDIVLSGDYESTSARLGELILTLNDTYGQIDAVLQCCGSHLKKIAYKGDGAENSPQHMTSWIGVFHTHCTSVTHLTLHNVHVTYFEQILAARSGTIESLELDEKSSSRSHLYFVVRHCRGLLELKIRPVMDLPKILWEKVGPTLRVLETATTRDRLSFYASIQKHCRKLTHVTIDNFDTPAPDELFKSFGEQLEYAKANFEDVPYGALESLSAACPRAIFDLNQEHFLDFNVVELLEYRVHTLRVPPRFGGPSSISFFVDLVHLRSLIFNCDEETAVWLLVDYFLKHPKPHLAELSITYTLENPCEILDTLAAKITSLTVLELNCERLPVDALAPVLAANPALVRLILKTRTRDLPTVRQVLRICASAINLRELRIEQFVTENDSRFVEVYGPSVESTAEPTTEPTVATEIRLTADACMPFRRRNTFVQIFSVDYVF